MAEELQNVLRQKEIPQISGGAVSARLGHHRLKTLNVGLEYRESQEFCDFSPKTFLLCSYESEKLHRIEINTFSGIYVCKYNIAGPVRVIIQNIVHLTQRHLMGIFYKTRVILFFFWGFLFFFLIFFHFSVLVFSKKF